MILSIRKRYVNLVPKIVSNVKMIRFLYVKNAQLMNQIIDKIFQVRVVHVWILIMIKVLKNVGNVILLAKPVNMETVRINVLLVMKLILDNMKK
jgi:hypothetical protein